MGEENNYPSYVEGYLAEIGISVTTDLSEYKANRGEYVKVDKEIMGRIDSIMQILPSVMQGQVNSGDVYRVIYDKGLGVLQKSAQHPGFKLANVVLPGTNNKIRDVALLQELSMGPQIASALFSAMSVVTGQYFMSQINERMNIIQKSLMEVQKFLENDKRSRLESNEEFLKHIQENMQYIIANESEKISTIVSINDIKKESLQNIIFYKKQINDLQDIDIKKDKAETVIANIENINYLISGYWYSLYLYCFASGLEPMLAQNYDFMYLSNIRKDMLMKCTQYEADYDKWKNAQNNYISSAKAFGENKILAALKALGKNKMYFDSRILIAQTIIGVGAEMVDNHDKNVKDMKQAEAYEHMNNGSWAGDTSAMNTKRKELLLLDMLYNQPIEVIKEHNEMYVRIPSVIEL